MKPRLTNIGVALLFSISVAIQASAKIIAHWNLDELSGASIVNDSIAEFIATPAGASTPVLGENGVNNDTFTSSKFSDSGYWRSEADASLAPTNFSFAFWVKGSGVPATADHAAVIGTRNNGENGSIFYSYRGKLSWWVRNDAGWSEQNAVVDFLTGSTWYHVVGTFNSGTFQKKFAVTTAGGTWIGFNSIMVTSAFWAPPEKRVGIGSRADGVLSAGLKGTFWIDDVQYYNHVLSDSEAQWLFEHPGMALHSDPEIKIISKLFVGDVVTKDHTITSAITVRNNGVSSNLVISAALTGDTDQFSLDSIPGPIAPGGGAGEIIITYAPQVLGNHSVKLRVISNDPSSPTNDVMITGTNGKLLRLHWKLDESAGSATIADAQGLYPGTLTGGVTLGVINSPSGTAADINGGTNYIRTAFVAGLQRENYTLSLWCKFNSTAAGCITDSGPDATGWRWYYSLEAAERLHIWNWGGPYNWVTHITNNVPINQWHHLAATYDSSTHRFSSYINGVPLMSTIQSNDYITPTNGWFSLGRRSDNGYNGIDGEIDDVQYYAIHLNDQDVLWLYENPGKTIVSRNTAGSIMIIH